MIVRKIKEMLVSGSEMILAVALVLIFFLAFTAILIGSFPKGTGLNNLYGDLITRERGLSDIAFGREARQFVAELVGVTRTVKDRAVNEVAWQTSRTGMALGNHHAVQTFDASGADISFGRQGLLSLGPNSLVVLRQEEQYDALADRAALVVLGGEVRGQLSRASGSDVGLEIVAAGATARLGSSGDDPAEFSVTVNADDSATLQILAGSAEITSGDTTQTVGPDEALTIRGTGRLGLPVHLPEAPRLLSPQDNATRVYGNAAPLVPLRWSENGAEGYRVIIARDAGLADVIHDQQTPGDSFEIGSLTEGRYYWTVAARRDDVESRRSEIRSFELVQDTVPPDLSVALPRETVVADRLLIHGITEPGATVLVGRQETPTGQSGEFELSVDLHPGPNVIVVEAVDPAGNVAYISRYVNAKPNEASRDRP